MIFLAMIAKSAFGQINPQNSRVVYFEFAGSGGLGSLNFEKCFLHKNNFDYSWRAGLSFTPIDKNNGVGIVSPLMINALIGKSSRKLELGLGQGITVTTKGSFFALTTAAIGYRYQSTNSKWFYRVTYTPVISYLVDFQIQQWGGVSIGYNLKTKEN